MAISSAASALGNESVDGLWYIEPLLGLLSELGT